MIKRKHILRTLLATGLVALIIAIAGIAVLRSPAFHRYVLAAIVERASQATGARAEIGSFQFHWSGLKVDFNQVVLHGTETPVRPPLLRVEHVRVGLKIISLWRRKIDVNEIVMDHPSIHMWVDQNGRTNLPQPPSSAPGNQTIFDLAIGHFVVNQGDLDYNDRHIPLDGEVHNLNAQTSFASLKTEYDGTLAYRDGRIQFGNFNPVQHSLQVRFGATPAGLTLDSLKLDAGSSTLSLQAHLQDYTNPSVDGSYQADVSTPELGKILKTAALPAGQVSLDGTLHYAAHADQALLDNLTLEGRFHSPVLALNTPQLRTSVRALTGDYRLGGGSLDARNVQAEFLGGRMSGNLTVTHLLQKPAAQVEAAAHNISVEAAGVAFGATPFKRSGISGRLSGTIKGSWEGSGENLQLRSDATITGSAPVRQGAGPGPSAIPLHGALHLGYNGQTGVISLNRTELATPHTTVKLDGSTGKQSSLGIQAHSEDLREVDQLALIARNAGGASRRSSPATPEPFGISGSGSFAGQLRGSINHLQLTGQVSSTNFQYQGTTLSELRTNLALSPSDITLSQGQIQTSDRGQVQFNLSAGLTNWSYRPQNQLRIDLTAARLPVATVERIANLHYPVTGTLAARISMHGSQSNLIGQGTATVTQATVWNQPVQILSVQFQGAGSSINSTVQLQTPAGSGSGKFAYDFRTEGYEAQFSVPNLQIEKLQAANQVKVQVSGVMKASLQGRGTVNDPQLVAVIQAPKLRVGEQTLDGLKLDANVTQHRATLTLDAATQGAPIQARANVNLNANYDTTATVDVRNFPLAPLLASYLPQAPAGLRGQTEVHASLHGPLKQRDQIQVEIDIPTLNIAYQTVQIGNASPIRAIYRGGVLSLERCELKGTGTDLQMQATIPVANARSMQAAAVGNLDLNLVQLLYPEWDISGQLHLDVGAEGVLAHPNVHGTVRVVDAALEPPGAPLGAQNLNATLAIHDGRVEIQNFTAKAGGGTLSAEGFATYQPAVQFDLRMSAVKVRLRYPQGTRSILDSTLLLSGSRDSALLSGQVVLDRLSLTKGFDLATFADQFNGNSSASLGPSFAQNVRLNVTLRSASEMAVENTQLSIQGSANLRVQGTAAEPVILGRTDITEGEIFFNGRRYKMESGVIQFANAFQTEPVLNVHVTTTVNQFDITLNFEGPMDRMRVTYTSDPPLAPIDIINLIARGQTTEAASASPSTPESVIAGQLTSQVSNRVQKLAGISSLTFDPQVGSGQSNGAGRLALQQRVTKNLYFSFTTDLRNSTGQIVQVEYQATRKFAVSTTRDQNGGYTVQVKMHRTF